MKVDFYAVIKDVGAAWKLLSTFSHEEIHSLLTNNESRESDVIAERPKEVVVALGEEFLSPKLLAEFRMKFCEFNNGKTVFDLRGVRGFVVEYLWADLVGEVRQGEWNGPVGVALREALGRMGVQHSCEFVETLEGKVRMRAPRSCGGPQGKEQEAESVVVGGGVMMDWVTRDLQWNRSLTPRYLSQLPFLLRYHGNVDPTSLSKLLLREKGSPGYSRLVFIPFLRLLVIVSSPRNDKRQFATLSTFFRDNIVDIPPKWQPVAKVFLGATREQIAAASSHSLVSDVSVGGVFLNLLQQQPPATNVHKETWEAVLSDAIEFTPCCDLPGLLYELQRQMEEKSELLKEVLTSPKVLGGWMAAYGLVARNSRLTCGVTHLLAFYFSVFGLNLDWMMRPGREEELAEGWISAISFPLEIACALQGNPHWTHLLPQFQQMLRNGVWEELRSVVSFADLFSFTTEAEWETLLTLIDGETISPRQSPDFNFRSISSTVAAPLLRALIKLYGVEWTKQKLTAELWRRVPCDAAYTIGSLASLGSLLHSAIQLGDLTEVKRRAWPGVVFWRNAEGKTALEIARETYDETHPIRIHLEQLTRSIKQPIIPATKTELQH